MPKDLKHKYRQFYNLKIETVCHDYFPYYDAKNENTIVEFTEKKRAYQITKYKLSETKNYVIFSFNHGCYVPGNKFMLFVNDKIYFERDFYYNTPIKLNNTRQKFISYQLFYNDSNMFAKWQLFIKKN